MSYLTERQRDILEFLIAYKLKHGISPTHREIREKFGYSSFGTVYKHLKLLQEKGYLHRDWNQKRGIVLAGDASLKERSYDWISRNVSESDAGRYLIEVSI